MSDISPEDSVKKALHGRIKTMLAFDEDIRSQERTLAETKRERDRQREEAERLHRGLSVLVPASTEPDFDKYARSYKRANPS